MSNQSWAPWFVPLFRVTFWVVKSFCCGFLRLPASAWETWPYCVHKRIMNRCQCHFVFLLTRSQTLATLTHKNDQMTSSRPTQLYFIGHSQATCRSVKVKAHCPTTPSLELTVSSVHILSGAPVHLSVPRKSDHFYFIPKSE